MEMTCATCGNTIPLLPADREIAELHDLLYGSGIICELATGQYFIPDSWHQCEDHE